MTRHVSAPPGPPLPPYRFGVFQFDAERLELYRGGRLVPLQPQPAQVLATLLERAGHIVTREDLRRTVWADDTFVDFDKGLNFCVAQVRSALGDDAQVPRFVRTVPKRGYEFIYPIDRVLPETAASAPHVRRDRVGLVLIAGLAGLAGLFLAGRGYVARARAVPVVAVARFDDETGDPRLAQFADHVTDTVVVDLAADARGRFEVVGNAAVLRKPRDQRDLRAISAALHAQYVVLGQVQHDEEHVRVLAHLIRLPEETHVTVSRTDGIRNPTLAEVDHVAERIATAFDRTLRSLTEKSSSFGRANR
jgi:DNA-binding winged helix-turn-helix (wHTH) protein/TolB-like protein